ncbi:unnamed protein product [Durusdinium trenchii]|uniref:Methenyltetrahydrofolate cyclohydrolase n=1 Tax=Durusdinium trenchii TaxID=1381693 RepID=A0ABP0SI74_9DINO
MARVIAASACGAVVALGLQKLLRGKTEARRVSAPVETKLIDGKAIAAEVRSEIKKSTAELRAEHNVTPGLAVILVGSRKDSQSYVRNKKKAAEEVGFHTVDIVLPETVSQEDLLFELEKLNSDLKVHAILVQLPLPKHIDEAFVLSKIRVDKDADGFSAENVGNLCMKGGFPPLAVPCTPAGCVELLQRSGVEVSGKNAVVVGRSNIVGMPVSQILQSMDATVTVCHSRTQDMVSYLRNADVVIAAVGKAEYVRGDWLKPGCVVIDVGINAVDDASKKLGYRLVGDVNFAEAQGVTQKTWQCCESEVESPPVPIFATKSLNSHCSLLRKAVCGFSQGCRPNYPCAWWCGPYDHCHASEEHFELGTAQLATATHSTAPFHISSSAWSGVSAGYPATKRAFGCGHLLQGCRYHLEGRRAG